ncbi:hypothetical protein PR258_03480 [Metamycoplasma hyosynoviae]|uniref:hypothetical protein n=1 Tax=Metamycoplasma hyosynoviae TaxID=29559 RepID=UPI0023595C69|nr:hypothetical protein [Metamycoplasma hyosynoviae]MDC8913421.1 hypothetical protein [Metamycoplasma hyosynoviae]
MLHFMFLVLVKAEGPPKPTPLYSSEESGLCKRQLYNLSISGTLISVDQSQKDEIIKLFKSMKTYGDENRRFLAYKNGSFYTKNSNGTKIEGISISDNSISKSIYAW